MTFFPFMIRIMPIIKNGNPKTNELKEDKPYIIETNQFELVDEKAFETAASTRKNPAMETNTMPVIRFLLTE